eukprot:PITA_09819
MEAVNNSRQQTNENHQDITAATAKQILNPTVFDNANIEELKRMHLEETTKEEAEFIDLKNNFLPAGLTPLEDMFDDNDVPKKPKMEPLDAAIEEHNIGTTEQPKMIKLSKNLPPDQKPKYVDLFKEFQDVFSWSYEDLKSYDTSIIQHTIPLKPNKKPFKQKLRRINPMLFPLIEKEVKRMFEAGIIRFPQGKNQVKSDYDQDKTTFTTPWGTFKYVKMLFGVKNAGATFQRAMDIAFAKEIHEFLVVYLDDLTPFSKFDQEHLKHLRQIFITCRKYDISLNPKKSLFGLEEGKLLGHIISKDGIRIDPERIQAILQIPYPRNIKELQAFLGKINFLRRFIPNLAEMIKLLSNMLKKDAKVRWSLETKQAFESIKAALTQMPVLTSPQFDKDFIIFSFASEHTIAVVLLQKDDQGNENTIAFSSRALRDAPLKYQIMEKQAYALVKAIKDFRVYILYSHVITYVPNSVVKDILTQKGLEGEIGKWITSILEYDIEIKPTKLIKGQGLAKLMSEINLQALDINQLGNEQELATPQINETFLQSPWYADICYVLLNLCAPPGLSRTKKRFLRMKASKFCVLDDVKKFVVSCHKCQIFEGKRKLLPFPLEPISTEQPFQKWGLDFIGEIYPSSSGHYFNKWIEAIPCRQANDSTIIRFLEDNILSRFGCPEKIITDNAAAFKSRKMINFCHKFHIILGHSSAYYPQGNGLAKSSNKILINIIKKMLEENKKNWHRKLTNALWTDRLSTKKSIGMSPYQLVYGMEAKFPSSLGIPIIKLL